MVAILEAFGFFHWVMDEPISEPGDIDRKYFGISEFFEKTLVPRC